MLDKVKMALRINHNLLDADILETIASARTDMVRAGVPSEVANNDDYPLTQACIKTYCLYTYATKDDSSRYWESYTYQLDVMRKSTLNPIGGE